MIVIINHGVCSAGDVRTHDSIFMDSEIDYDSYDEPLSKDDHDEAVGNEATNSDYCKEEHVLQKELFCNYRADEKIQTRLFQALDPCLCTHLVYSSISEMNTVQNLNADNFKKIIMLKTKNRNLKILFDMQISEQLLKDDMNVTKAMEGLMDLLTDLVSNGFLDGISLNFKLTNNFTNPKQAINFVFILIEFFRYVSEVSDKPNFLLAIKLPQNYKLLFDEDAISYLNQFIDYFILPTFRPTHLERLTNEGLFEFSPDMSKTESIVHSLLQTGVSNDKLIISIPIFGMAYVLNNSTDVNGRSSNREKILSYPQVCSIISSAHWNTTNTNGCCSTYVTNSIFWITYSNQINVQAEVTYTILRRLGGVSLSALNDDDYRGVCRKGNFPLLSKANDVLRKKDVEVVRDANDLLIHEESRLLKVFTPLTSEDTSPYNCKRNGYYRDRSNCTRFYQCAKQMPIGAKSRFAIFLFECPFGLAFDEKFQICNFQLWSQSCDASNEISPVPASTFHCSSPGYHKDPEHCKWFYYCSSFGGDVLRAYEFRCPTSDLAFDDEKLLCNWRHLVPGCGEKETPIYTPHKHLNAHTETARVAKSFKIKYDTNSYASIRLAQHGNQQEEWRGAKKLDNPNLEVTQRRKISEFDAKERDDNIDPYASITSRHGNQQKEEREAWRFDAPNLEVTHRRKQLFDIEDMRQDDEQEDHRHHDKIPGVLYITDINKEIPAFTGDEGINNTPYLSNEYQQYMPRSRQNANDQIINNGNVRRNHINPHTSVITAHGYQQQQLQTARQFEPYDVETTERRKPTAVNEAKDQGDKQIKYMNDQEIPGVLYVTDIHSKNSNIFHGNEEINNTPQLSDEHQELSSFRQNSSRNNKAGTKLNGSKQRSIDWLRFIDIPHNISENTNTPRSHTGLRKIDKSNEARVQCSKMETYQAQANNIADKIQNEHPLGCVSEISVSINMPKNTSGVHGVMKLRTPRNRAYGRSLGINSEELLDPSKSENFEDDNKVFIKTRSTANYNDPIILLVKATSNINPSEKSKDVFSGQQSVTRPFANFERSSKRLTGVTGQITPEIDEIFPERVNRSMLSFDKNKTVSNDNSNIKLQTTTYDSSNLQQNSQTLKDKFNIKPNTRDSLSNGPKFLRREPSTEGETEFFENTKQTTARYMNNKNDVNFSGRSVSSENNRKSSGLLLDVDINGRQQMLPGVLYVVERKRWQKQQIPHVEYHSLKDDINSNPNIGKSEKAHVSTLPNANNEEVSQVYISSTVSPSANNREANQAYFSNTVPINTQRRASQVEYSSTSDTSREAIQVHSSSTTSPNANGDANHEKMLSTRPDSKTADFSQSYSTGGLSSVTNSKDVMTGLEQDTKSGNAKPTTQTLQNNDLQGHIDDTSSRTNSGINRISKQALDHHLEHEQVDQNMPQNQDTMTKERPNGINPFRNKFTSLRQQLQNQNQNSDFVVASHHDSYNRLNHNSRIPIMPMKTHTTKPAFGARVTRPKSNTNDNINTRSNLDSDQNLEKNLELNHGDISKKNDTILGEINRIKEELRTLRHSPITTNRLSINTTRTIAEKTPRTSRQHFPQFNSEFLPRQWLVLPLNPRTEDSTNTGNSRMPKHIDLPSDRRQDTHDKQRSRYANNSTSNSQIYTEVRREQKHNALFRWNVAFLNDKKHISTPNVVCTSEGLFFDPDDCSKFYECYWDQWLEKFTIHMFSCPVTLVFDERISGCVYQDDQAPCIRT